MAVALCAPRRCTGYSSRSPGEFFAEGIHRLVRQQDACPNAMGAIFKVHRTTAHTVQFSRSLSPVNCSQGIYAPFLRTLFPTIRQTYRSLTLHSHRKCVIYDCARHYQSNRLLQCTRCTIKMQLNYDSCKGCSSLLWQSFQRIHGDRLVFIKRCGACQTCSAPCRKNFTCSENLIPVGVLLSC
jgi:hypothetical protein